VQVAHTDVDWPSFLCESSAYVSDSLWSRQPVAAVAVRSSGSRSIPHSILELPTFLNNFKTEIVQWRDVPQNKMRICIFCRFPLAARCNAWVCGRLLAGTAGLNPAEEMEVCVWWVLCVVRYSYLRRADHSSGGVLQNVTSGMRVITKPRKGRLWLGMGSKTTKENCTFYV